VSPAGFCCAKSNDAAMKTVANALSVEDNGIPPCNIYFNRMILYLKTRGPSAGRRDRA